MGFDGVNRNMRPLNFTDPIHIVHGSAGGTVYHTVKKPRPDLIVLTDSLMAGPCKIDRDRHGEGRLAYWQFEFDRQESPRRRLRPTIVMDRNRLDVISYRGFIAALASFPSDRPIVVWSTPSLSDRVTLWWTLDAIDHLGLDRNRIWTGQPCLDHEATEESLMGLGVYPESAFLRGFESLQPLSAGLLRAGSGLWRSFAGPSPLLFEQACLKRRMFFSEAITLLEYHARLFPGSPRGRSGQLKLSFLDQFILGGLSTDDWKRPFDVLQADKEKFYFLMNMLNGDQWMPRRLLDWSEHEKDNPLVVRRHERTGVNHFTRTSYLLTARGQTVRRDGMTSVADAPPLHVGGCSVHDPEHPWVSFVDNAGIHVEFRKLGA
jgi:hypothetical protein